MVLADRKKKKKSITNRNLTQNSKNDFHSNRKNIILFLNAIPKHLKKKLQEIS